MLLIVLLAIQIKTIVCPCNISARYGRCDTLNDAVTNWNGMTYSTCTEITIGEDEENHKNYEYALNDKKFVHNFHLEKISIFHQLVDVKINALQSEQLPGLKHVNLRYNNLMVLRQKSFVGFNLSELFLSHNRIHVIEPRTFDRTNVGYLSLTHNNISVLFENHLPGEVVNLELEFNQLCYIQERSLPSSLVYLSLHNNNFKDIEHCGLDNLTTLITLKMSHNLLRKINKFPALPQLNQLDLSYNKIQYIEPNSFANAHKITSLNLGYNEIKSISFLYNTLPNLKYLQMQYNFLGAGSLENVSKMLKEVTILGNPISCTCLKIMEQYCKSNEMSFKDIDDFKTGRKPICIKSEISCNASYLQRSEHEKLEEFRRFLKIVQKVI